METGDDKHTRAFEDRYGEELLYWNRGGMQGRSQKYDRADKQKKKDAMCSRPSWTNATEQRTQSSGDEYDAEYYWMEGHEGHARLASLRMNQASPHNLSDATVCIKINDVRVNCLIDSGSTESFINQRLVNRLAVPTCLSEHQILLAASNLAAEIKQFCRVTLEIQGTKYEGFKLLVLPHLCALVLLGLDFQCQLESITIVHNGPHPPLRLLKKQHCSLSVLNIELPLLFTHLTPECTPIATKSRRYSPRDRTFIRTEVRRLLQEGIIEQISSPWRAQVVVVKSGEKLCMVVNYSQTINKFTQ
ncbi:uncharacterized protein [Narcine bancroftii]|uniref:uncharacterized protein n=1 Tax=Narcine bancroftii TaxID=1343680 RepID=UPI0038310094